jgi:pyruvate-formate lyase-activating enzyme
MKVASPPPLRAVIKLTYACNNRCMFCRVEDYRGTVEDVPAEAILRKVMAARDRGVQMVLFSGGEPTIRRDLPGIARATAALGLRWGLITNGRLLADHAYRERLISAGLAYVHTSLHGALAETHDSLVQCASFSQVLTALEGLAGRGLELHVNTVITRPNVDQLSDIGNLLAPFAPITHKMCLAEPRGLFEEYGDRLLVPPELAGRAAVHAVQEGRARHGASGLRFEIEGFPRCQIPGAHDAAGGLHSHNIRYMSEGFEDTLFPTDHGDRVFLTPCDDCTLRPDCPGVYPGYAQRFGVVGLRASRRPRNPGKPPGTAG